jgi:pyruvate formate lyase activating enzyme
MRHLHDNAPQPASKGGGVVFNIMRYSVADGPGLRTTVFLKGCPLHCPWCHNPESQARRPQPIHRLSRCLGCEDCLDACPQLAISPGPEGYVTDPKLCVLCGECVEACPTGARDILGRVMSLEQVMAEIIKDLPFFEESSGGVTLSGGEPLCQPEFAAEVLAACKAQDIHTALDTSGCVPYDIIDSISSHVDLFLYDLKMMDDLRHQRLMGVGNQLILENLKRLISEGHKVLVRMPLVPGVNDSVQDIERAAGFLTGLKQKPEVELLPHHDTAKEKYRLLGMPHFKPPGKGQSAEHLQGLANIMRAKGLECKIGGQD